VQIKETFEEAESIQNIWLYVYFFNQTLLSFDFTNNKHILPELLGIIVIN